MLSRLLSAALMCVGVSLWAQAGHAQPDYVQVCDQYGTGFFYIPGDIACTHADTGDTRTEFSDRFERRESKVAARITALESIYCDTCFAVVRPDGSLAKSAGIQAGNARTAKGKYQLVFKQSLALCAISATLANALPGTPPLPGFITAAQKAGDVKALLVETRGINGVLDDRSFHITFECVGKPPFVQVSPL